MTFDIKTEMAARGLVTLCFNPPVAGSHGLWSAGCRGEASPWRTGYGPTPAEAARAAACALDDDGRKPATRYFVQGDLMLVIYNGQVPYKSEGEWKEIQREAWNARLERLRLAALQPVSDLDDLL